MLLIRLQALGDVVITLPYAQALLQSLPGCRLDLLTREEVGEIPASLRLFGDVLQLGGGRDQRRQMLHALALLPRLWRHGYEVVLDLQNNRLSRLVRRLLRPGGWSAFDRFSPLSAGERTRRTIEAAGFPLPRVSARLQLRDQGLGLGLLAGAGWRPGDEIVVLNPAGAFPSRNWPLQNYVAFAEAWSARRAVRFVFLGLPSLRPKADLLAAWLGGRLIDLVGRTRPAEAFAIVGRASLVLSEDSGLMHMAWVQGVPTLALFGSSRHDWSAPLGTHSRCLDSGDLPCAACMEAECRFGDVRCLTRHTPERVVAEAEALLAGLVGGEPALAGGA